MAKLWTTIGLVALLALIAVPAVASQGNTEPPPTATACPNPSGDHTLPYNNTVENTAPFDDGTKSWMKGAPSENYTAVGGLGWSVKGYYDPAVGDPYTMWETVNEDRLDILADIELWLEHEAPYTVGYFHIGRDPVSAAGVDPIIMVGYLRSNNGNAIGVVAPSLVNGNDYDCDDIDVMQLWHSWFPNFYTAWAVSKGLMPGGGTAMDANRNASFDITWQLKDDNRNDVVGYVETNWRDPDEIYGTPPKSHWWVLGPQDEDGVAGQAPLGGQDARGNYTYWLRIAMKADGFENTMPSGQYVLDPVIMVKPIL